MTDTPADGLPSTVTAAAAALRAGTVTSTALVEHAVRTADRLDPRVGSFISRYREESLAAAARADADFAAGTDRGPLQGIPFGVKDIIASTDGPTTAQSLVLDPAWGEETGDAVVVSRLRAAGAIVVGKASTMEFAIGSPDPEKPFPIPANPWDLERWAGGSSSGTGSGVAAGMFLAGLGTDTAGSIRIPSAYCGITGLKPTFGRVPKSGCVPLGYTLDNIGPMARSAADCALLLGLIAGPDASDHYSADVQVDDYSGALADGAGDLSGLTIGVDDLVAASDGHVDPAFRARFDAALGELAAAGARIVPLSLPLYAELTAADMVVMLSEALAYHQGDLSRRWADYGAGTRMTVGSGFAFTGADYVQAQRVRRVGQRMVAGLLEGVDAIVTPTSTLPAPRLDEFADRVPLLSFGGLHTPYWNSVGNPTLAVPIGPAADGLPLSMQISTRPFAEALALRVGDAYQRRTAHHLSVPPLALAEPVAAVN
ncbi:amidase [Phaeacidiphilus oryzae]|uniref:amidase n=1 Tax=Phaeacidiphilus oryzae TaxID=348818 RepID=UPI0005651D1F|nr:amidase [Phaeacidiphilus oryzae]